MDKDSKKLKDICIEFQDNIDSWIEQKDVYMIRCCLYELKEQAIKLYGQVSDKELADKILEERKLGAL